MSEENYRAQMELPQETQRLLFGTADQYLKKLERKPSYKDF